MYKWRHIPILRLLLPFIAGIATANYILVPFFIPLCILSLTSIIYLWINFRHRNKVKRLIVQCSSFLIYIGLYVLAYTFYIVDVKTNSTNHFSIYGLEGSFLLQIIEAPVQKAKSVQCNAKVLEYNMDREIHPVSGNLLVYFRDDKKARQMAYGDIILIRGEIKALKEPLHPYMFNSKRYYAHKNIGHSVFIDSTAWVYTGFTKCEYIKNFSIKLREKLHHAFVHCFEQEKQRGFAEALVFGYRDNLDKDLQAEFAKSGTIHVLAVSGLHVGIIYFILSSLLGLQNAKRKRRLLKVFVILAVLTFYALLTGLSAPVCRAVLMFGIFLIGNAIGRRGNSINSLGVACFILLVIDPKYLFQLGFQFSFLAVLGILIFTPLIRSLWSPRGWLGHQMWSLACVSIAAQITTFPLGLYYFHQFPFLFILTNLFVIPFITMLLYIGIALALVYWVSAYPAIILANLMSVYIDFLSSGMQFFNSFPFASLSGVYLQPLQLLLCFFLLCFISLGFMYRSWFFIVLACVSMIFCGLNQKKTQQAPEILLVEDGYQHWLLFFNRQEAKVLCLNRHYSFYFYQGTIEPLLQSRGIRKVTPLPRSVLNHPADLSGFRVLAPGLIWYGNSAIMIEMYKQTISWQMDFDMVIFNNQKQAGNKKVKAKHKIYLNTSSSRVQKIL